MGNKLKCFFLFSYTTQYNISPLVTKIWKWGMFLYTQWLGLFCVNYNKIPEAWYFIQNKRFNSQFWRCKSMVLAFT